MEAKNEYDENALQVATRLGRDAMVDLLRQMAGMPPLDREEIARRERFKQRHEEERKRLKKERKEIEDRFNANAKYDDVMKGLEADEKASAHAQREMAVKFLQGHQPTDPWVQPDTATRSYRRSKPNAAVTKVFSQPVRF